LSTSVIFTDNLQQYIYKQCIAAGASHTISIEIVRITDTVEPPSNVQAMSVNKVQRDSGLTGMEPSKAYISHQLNRILRESSGEYILLLDSNTLPFAGFIDHLWNERSSDNGVIVPRVLYPSGRLRHGGYTFKDTPVLQDTSLP